MSLLASNKQHIVVTERYVIDEVLGKGQYAEVRKAYIKKTGQPVAIKISSIKDSPEMEGIHLTVLQEIKLLKEIVHPNIIRLFDVFRFQGSVAMVLEFAVGDVESLIRDRDLILSPSDIKSIAQMMFQAVQACHRAWVIHGDLKPNNFLVGSDGAVRLADFGLSRVFGMETFRHTNMLFAHWYRAPELYFGSTRFGGAPDVWAVGCIFAELILRGPLFPGNTDRDQLSKIFAVLGTPTEDDWPGATKLPAYVAFAPRTSRPLAQVVPQASPEALDLLSKLLQLNPLKRISMDEALKHPYFTKAAPAPTPVEKLHRSGSKIRERMEKAVANPQTVRDLILAHRKRKATALAERGGGGRGGEKGGGREGEGRDGEREDGEGKGQAKEG